MASVDELCQFARSGQTSKMQKYLQTHSIDVNSFNLYGESALSTATYHNQIFSVQFLLTNKADPKLRLPAGHTAVHVACQLANIPILHLLLSIKVDDSNNDEQRQKLQDKHLFECLQVKDSSELTPIHWAATQESISKRQKIFSYLDQRMPGVLESRYNIHWFDSWAKTHPWVIEISPIKNLTSNSTIELSPRLINTDKKHSQKRLSLPVNEKAHLDTVKSPTSPSLIIRNIHSDNSRHRTKQITNKIEKCNQSSILPPTPISSCVVARTNPLAQYACITYESHQLTSTPLHHNTTRSSLKTPCSQKLSSLVKHALSPVSSTSIYRAERVYVIPAAKCLNSPTHSPMKPTKDTNYDDIMTPISLKRPSHNLLSNIVPPTTSPSSDRSSRQSTKPYASYGFDTSIDPRDITTNESYIQNDQQIDDDSLDHDDNYDNDETNEIDYLCQSASTIDSRTPDTYK